jgi:hypothetical protein
MLKAVRNVHGPDVFEGGADAVGEMQKTTCVRSKSEMTIHRDAAMTVIEGHEQLSDGQGTSEPFPSISQDAKDIKLWPCGRVTLQAPGLEKWSREDTSGCVRAAAK